MAEVKIGFVGAGGMARSHMRALRDIADARIVAICDIEEARAKEAADEFGGRVYTDHHELLEREELDALYVVVPPFAHTDAEILAAQKGVHLMVEKPVALTMEKALEIQQAIAEAGVISCVGYQLRYAEPSQRMKRWLADKTVAMVICERLGGLPGTPWWRIMSQSGGQLVEQTTHQVDMMRFLVGEIVEVYARYGHRGLPDVPDADVPDAYCVVMEFENGAPAVLSSTCALKKSGGRWGLTIILPDQRAEWRPDGNQLFPEDDPELTAPPQGKPNINAAFVEAVKTGNRELIMSTYEDAVKSLAVTIAANESAASGKPVKPAV